MNTLSILYAQWGIETARGKSMWNDNFGNIKYVAGAPYDFVMLRTFEFDNAGNKYWVDAPFRSYETALDGAKDYLQFLSRASYAKPWARARAGDLQGFAEELRARGYYTAPVSDYVRGMRVYAAEFFKQTPSVLPTLSGGVVLNPDDAGLVCYACHDLPGLVLSNECETAAHRLGEETDAERAIEEADQETRFADRDWKNSKD